MKNSIKYFNETNGDILFNYRETQVHSALCPAISKISGSFLIEHPIERKSYGKKRTKRKKIYTGRLDYWVFYRDFSFAVEVKHSFQGYSRTKKLRGSLIRKLRAASVQLKSVTNNSIDNLSVGAKNLINVPLICVTYYKGSNEENQGKN